MMRRAARSMRFFAHAADPAGLLQTRRLGPPLEKPDAMRLLIVWHSRTGMAKQMAEALYTGALKAMQDMEAAETDFAIDLLRAQDAQVSDLLSAHGFLFCAPENLASMSGEMKEFFDRCYYGALGRLNGRPFALAVCGGSDGEGAANQMARICRGWRLKNLAVPLILRSGAQTPEAVAAAKVLDTSGTEKCMDLGGLMAAHMLLGVP
ncbi:fldA [Symbiodinium sp. CCMP2456]|nr:fldA [Symbiodinium sp. CCMP2456]